MSATRSRTWPVHLLIWTVLLIKDVVGMCSSPREHPKEPDFRGL